MKKFIIPIIIIMIISMTKGDSITIPDEALRFRIIANSNTEEDQKVKLLVKEKIQTNMYSYLKETKSISEAKTIINANLYSIDNTIFNVLEENNYSYEYDINLGMNYFPEKNYKGIVYEEGKYESLVITLGNGEGENWWCVLFPPLCLIEAEENNTTEVEYKLFIKEILDKYTK